MDPLRLVYALVGGLSVLLAFWSSRMRDLPVSQLGWAAVGFAGAVLLFRRIPVLLLLRRPLWLALRDAVFLGWFGPIGVNAVFYLTHAEEQDARERLWAAGSLVVAVSTLVHGISSAPGRRAYGRAARRPGASVPLAPG